MKLNSSRLLLFSLLGCQLLVDFPGSVTIFPFLHYGMFSGESRRINIQTFEINVDGSILKAAEYEIAAWDMITGPLYSFQKQLVTDDFNDDKKIIAAVIGQSYMSENALQYLNNNLSNNALLKHTFPSWYKMHLSKIIGTKIKNLKVSVLLYDYRNNEYLLTSRKEWIKN